MNQKHIVRSAMAGLFALGTLGVLPTAHAADPKGMEKCFGVAKAGQNDCGSNKTAHACAGQSKMDNDPHDFKFVKTGTCASMGGSLMPGGTMKGKK